MLRLILGLIVGVIAGMAGVLAVEMIGMAVFPPPPMDFNDPEAMKSAAAAAPMGAKIFVIAAWGVRAFVGGWVTARIAKRAWAVWVPPALILAASLYNLAAIPSPWWMWSGGIALVIVGAWAASRMAKTA